MHPFEQNKRYYELAEKWKNGSITPEEEQQFADWYLTNQDDPVFLSDEFVIDESTHEQRMLTGLQHKVRLYPRSKRNLRQWLPYVAASFLLVACFGWWLSQLQQKDQFVNSPLSSEKSSWADIKGGIQQAYLTLDDGLVIPLDQYQSGIVMGEESITYQNGKHLHSGTSKKHTLHTPRGSTYHVILSDGSKVWLNAGSSLTYPSSFDSEERMVELDGEAYFEVNHVYEGLSKGEKISLPFLVHTKGQVVEVLGTKFNVAAYEEDEEIKTTLVSGKVQVIGERLYEDKRESLILLPGEQSVWKYIEGLGQRLTKASVSVNKELAWRSGQFNFDDKNFEQIMAEIGRWYDLEVVYEGAVPTETFFGNAFRTDNLSVILDLLESSRIQYRVSANRQLIISNK